ncbi:MAG: helix-turn-helix transcriptional regulator [Stenotrophomonas sp.]|nr:helix-turn-helix transcriptional regulator [Stenotrophomonas sp.]
MMNKAEIQVPKRLLRDDALDWFERNDGPPVIAFRFDSQQGLAREVDWHHHQRAQLICVERGLLTTRTSHGTWSLAPGSAGWMPPLEPHTVTLDGPLRGWGMALAAPACATLPADPCVLGLPKLAQALADRICEWPLGYETTPERQHIIDVLLDEIRTAPRQRMHLPMPHDRRLLKIASQLLADPSDERSLAEWAHWAGLYALGFSSASAFVTVFRRHFGLPPGRYLARAGHGLETGLDPARGLASPAASG